MSDSMNVYVVDIDRLRRAMGSGDQALIREVSEGAAGLLEQFDDPDADADPADDPIGMTCRDAVAQLIDGRVGDDAGPGYLYGYALEAICSVIGRELENICPLGNSDGLKHIDQLVAGFGAPVGILDLAFGGSPVPIPEPDDYPFIGRWTAEQATAVAAALGRVDPGTLGSYDETTDVALLRRWAEATAAEPGAWLVGFLS